MGEKNKRKKTTYCGRRSGVYALNIHDTKSGISTAKEAYTNYPSIQKFCADAGYRGTFVSDVKERLGLGVDISEKIKPHQWEKLPWRWVVERTFSWLNNSRRLSKDYEFSVSSSESMAIISQRKGDIIREWK